MNMFRHVLYGIGRVGLVVAAGGTVLASSCSTSDVKAILAGVEVATNVLDRGHNNDISFSDWLSSELDD